MGIRYENGDLNYDDRAELLTILNMYSKKPEIAMKSRQKTDSAFYYQHLLDNGLYAKLNLDPRTRPARCEFSDEINRYADTILASDLSEALDLAPREVPPFVALHVLGRHANSAADAHRALRAFEQWLPQVPEHVKPELTVLMLHMAQKHLLDVVPNVIELFVNQQTGISRQVLNELLWQIARFGKKWSPVDTPLLSKAQEVLLMACGVDEIDSKGLVALAYIRHFLHPEEARRAVVDLAEVVADRTPQANAQEFAYTTGPLAIRVLTAHSVEEALELVADARQHVSTLWTVFTLYLSRSKALTPGVAAQLWTQIMRKNLRVSKQLVTVILSSLPSFASKQRVLNDAMKMKLRLTPQLVAKMMSVHTTHDLATARETFAEFGTHPLVLEQVLITQSYIDPAQAWDTYCKLKVPSRRALQSLCRAAWDVHLLWGDMYASQRALREVKLHVRGSASPADDMLRWYPDDDLLYSYVVMVGRSGYFEELLNFLPWMAALEHSPSKRVLLALIYYSPQGPALLKLSEKVPNWPSKDEFDAYRDLVELRASKEKVASDNDVKK